MADSSYDENKEGSVLKTDVLGRVKTRENGVSREWRSVKNTFSGSRDSEPRDEISRETDATRFGVELQYLTGKPRVAR
jgi:hypothetical protein